MFHYVCQNRVHEDKTCAEQEHSPETANMSFLKDGKVKSLSSSLNAKSYQSLPVAKQNFWVSATETL